MIGVPSSLPSATWYPPAKRAAAKATTAALSGSEALLPLVASLLVIVPVFLQAPWVRAAPMAAAAFTVPLLGLALLLERRGRGGWQPLGVLLVGFCGSWLGGTLFWGWCRLHPLWHLPVEAFALPLALGGLGTRWRLGGAFYLASLLGTAATDGAIACSGLMPLWPQVLRASLAEAPLLLRAAGEAVLQPLPLAVVALLGTVLVALSRWLWLRGGIGRVAAATLATTLAVDALFLGATLAAPPLSGLI